MTTQTTDELLRENEELRRRLEEAEDAIRALRAGEADAVLIENGREQVYTLETADKPYRLLVAQAPHAAVTLTADGGIICSNRRFADLLGRTQAFLGDQPLRDFVAPDSLSTLDALLRAGQTSVAQGSVTFLREDGTPITIWLGVSPFREGALGQCLMVTDLTEQRHYEELERTQAALSASEDRYRTLFESIDEGFCVIEMLFDETGRPVDYRFLETNPAFDHHTGLRGTVGKSMRELAPAHEEYWFQIYGEVARTGEPIRFQRFAEALKRWYDVYAFRVGDPRERKVAVLFNDITERKRTEEALHRQQRRLQLISDSVPALISYVDPECRYQFCNRAYSDWFGLSCEEIIGKTMREVLGDEAWMRVGPHVEAALAGTPADFEVEAHYSHGPSRWIHANYTPDRDADGHVRGLVVLVSDVTARKQQESRLVEQARLLDLSNDAIFVRDRDDRIIYWNRGARELYGYTFEEAVGKVKFDLLQTEFPEAREKILDVLNRDGRWEGEVVHRRKNGERVTVFARWVLDRAPDGQTRRILETTNDITVRKKAEQALHDADRRKDEFLATLAHELRNPLAPVRNAVQILLARGPSDPLLVRARGTIDRQIRIMARLLDDLLDVSRISRHKLELRREHITLSTVVQDAVEISAPLVDAGGHALSITLPPEPVQLEADPVRLAQVFANLLNNAAKYTERAGRIALSAERHGADVVVSVKDTGIGISAEAMPKIFEIFSQAQPALERAQGGLGIGLSLVKGVVELHGGSVCVRSDGTGKGSEFVVRLPVATAPAPIQTPPPAVAESSPPAARRRILIADDNEDSADSLAQLLEIQGHEVATAYDGEQAVALAEAMRPDVALLDLGMPKVNGFDACRRIREQPWGRNVYLVALTGWGQDDDRRRTREAGFDHHFVKPLESEALERLLASLPTPAPTRCN